MENELKFFKSRIIGPIISGNEGRSQKCVKVIPFSAQCSTQNLRQLSSLNSTQSWTAVVLLFATRRSGSLFMRDGH